MLSKNKIVNLFLTTVSGLVILTSCGSPVAAPKKRKKRVVRVATAKEVRLVEVVETTGDVVAVNVIILRAAVEGLIKCCPWREGDVIEKVGQKVIEIDRPIYRHQLAVSKAELKVKKAILNDLRSGPRAEEIDSARASVDYLKNSAKFAEINLGRINSLVKKNAVSRQVSDEARVNYAKIQSEFAEAKDKLKMLEEGTKKTLLFIATTAVGKAQANVDLAQAKVDECIIKAPFAGVITKVFVRPGELTHLSSPRMSLIKLMDPKSLIVRAGMPESSAANIVKGARVKVRLDAFPGKVFNAKVELIHARIEQSSRTRIIEARIIEPVKLIPRMFARVSVETRVIEKAIVVPDSAIITTAQGGYVLFVVKDGKAEKRKVILGIEEGTNIQILKGVDANETVVTSGNLNLKSGTSIVVAKRIELK